MLTFTADQLRDAGYRIFAAAGAPDDVARTVTDSLVGNNLAGHDSHGVIRIPYYVESSRTGQIMASARPSIIRETPTTALVTGNWSFGQVAAQYALNVAIEKAKTLNVGIAPIVECNHVGRLGEYMEIAAAAGMVAMMTVGGWNPKYGVAPPFGGAARALSTNPIAFGVPGKEYGPMIVDFATTIVAEGKLQMLRAKKEPVPEGYILDKAGKPTTNVEDFYAGGMLNLFGGHKGYALSMIAELFSLAFSGLPDYRGERHGGGSFLMVINPTAFQSFADFAEDVDMTLERIKKVPPAAGFSEVLVPGEPEQRSRAKRLAEGIPVPEETWRQINETAGKVGVELKAIKAK